jgi:hypothetical protein
MTAIVAPTTVPEPKTTDASATPTSAAAEGHTAARAATTVTDDAVTAAHPAASDYAAVIAQAYALMPLFA